MRLYQWSALSAAFVIPALLTRAPVPARLPAEVRFANHLSGTPAWTVLDNGTPLFESVATNTTTAYVPVSDTTSRLALRRAGSDSIRAKTAYQFVAGSYYTITADYRSGGSVPVLSVERDRPPGDTAPSLPAR